MRRHLLSYSGATATLAMALTACSAEPGNGNDGPSHMASGGAGLAPPEPGSGGAPAPGAGGSTGSGGIPGSGGVDPATGGVPPNPRDPSITFDWPEWEPDSEQCQAGHYVGTYSCNITDPGGFSFPMSGPVDLVLAESQDGEFLTVSGGTLKSAAGIIYAEAGLIGQLSCASGEFTGTLENGTLSIQPFPPGGTFGGDMQATFVRTGPMLDGTWALFGGGPFAGYGCNGEWSATLQP